MKRIMRIILVSVLVLAAASANAAVYKVKKGDNLSKIGKMYNLTWQAIAKSNADKVKNPHRIYQGQELKIPEKCSDMTKAKKPFFWKTPGLKPLNRPDFVKAINLLNLPQEVKILLIAEVKSGRFEWHQIKSGDHFEQMVFGKYRVINDIYAQWKSGRLLAARKYSVKYYDNIYYLTDPLICRNWSWWAEKIPPPLPEPESVPLPHIIETEKPKLKKQLLMMLIPPEDEDPVAPLEIPLPLSVVEEKCQPDFEAWAYSGYSRGVQANRDDWTLYRGGNISLFPCGYRLGGGVFRIGPAYQWVDWNGQVGDIIDYSGQMFLFGGEIQYITGSTKSQFKMYYGKKTDDIIGREDLAPLKSRQWNHVLAIEPSHQWWQDGGNWFTEYEVGGRFEFDLGGVKHSSWDDQKINDPRTGQGVFMLRGQADVYRMNNAVLKFQLAPGYEQSPQTWFIEPRVGLKFFEIVEPAISYKWNEGPQNDSVVGHIVINASELIKRVWQMYKANKAEKGGKK